jgi:hypothetical protein
MTSSTIVTLRRVAAATVSHHPKILSHAGLIECRRQGQFVHNRAVPETIEDYARALLTLSQGKASGNKERHMDKLDRNPADADRPALPFGMKCKSLRTKPPETALAILPL